jgi:hypothetical protein
VGEGRQIVFVDPERLSAMPVAETAAFFVGEFLRSDAYRSLVAE